MVQPMVIPMVQPMVQPIYLNSPISASLEVIAPLTVGITATPAHALQVQSVHKKGGTKDA
jgi:hypothetical protein